MQSRYLHQWWLGVNWGLRDNFSEIVIKISNNSFKKMNFKMLSAKMLAYLSWQLVNTLRLRQNGRHFADYIFKCISLNENVWIPIKNSLKFVPKGPTNNIPALFQIMAWRRPGNKPLSEPMMINSLTHVCVTQPQWVKQVKQFLCLTIHTN